MAIPDFKNLGQRKDAENLSANLSATLTEKLRITGFFKIINKDAFLEDQDRAGITADSIDFSDWSSIGSEFLVKGGFQYNGKDLSVEFRLFDVVGGKQITGKKYWGKPEEIKTMVLKFANEIILALTGERGVFETKIAFTGKKGKISNIYTINFDGSELAMVTRNKSLNLLPHWSLDGKKISFTSYIRGNPDFYIKDLSTGKSRMIMGFKGLNLSGPWSPDGGKVLLTLSKTGNEEIYVMDLARKKLRRLTYDSAIDVSPTWSPDGAEIAFVSNRSGSPQIFIMNSDGSKVRRLTYEGNYNTSPCWCPGGKRIAYEGVTNGCFQIFSIDKDGSNLLQLTFENVSIQPGGKPVIGKFIQILMNPGDEVLYPNPGYPIYESAIEFAGATAVPLPYLEERGFVFELETLKRLITDKTKMIVINSPQNPTGGYIEKQDLEELAKICVKNNIIVSTYDSLLLSSDNGESWVNIVTELPFIESNYSLAFDTVLFYGGGLIDTIFRSDNLGQSWTPITRLGLPSYYGKRLNSIVEFKIHCDKDIN